MGAPSAREPSRSRRTWQIIPHPDRCGNSAMRRAEGDAVGGYREDKGQEYLLRARLVRVFSAHHGTSPLGRHEGAGDDGTTGKDWRRVQGLEGVAVAG